MLNPTAALVAATLRAAADRCSSSEDAADLRAAAADVERDWDGVCCPVCDEGCPLAEVRADKRRADLAGG